MQTKLNQQVHQKRHKKKVHMLILLSFEISINKKLYIHNITFFLRYFINALIFKEENSSLLSTVVIKNRVVIKE